MADIQSTLVMARVCELCLAGKGGQCNVPHCAFFLNRAPDLPLCEPLWERLTSPGVALDVVSAGGGAAAIERVNSNSGEVARATVPLSTADDFEKALNQFDRSVRDWMGRGQGLAGSKATSAYLAARRQVVELYEAVQRRAEGAEKDWQATERSLQKYDAQWDRLASALGIEDEDCEAEKIADRAVAALTAAREGAK